MNDLEHQPLTQLLSRYVDESLRDVKSVERFYHTPLTPHYHEVPKEIADNLKYRQQLAALDNYDDRKAIIAKCREDVLFYINSFVWTYSPKDSPASPCVPFITWPFQDAAILKIVENLGSDDIVIAKSRDMGATWLTLAIIEWRWHFFKEQAFLLVSRKEEYVDKRDSPRELFWKLDYIHRHQPRWILPPRRIPVDKDTNRKRKNLYNPITQSTIVGEASVSDLARGDRLTAIMIDEAAAIPNMDQVNRATRDATNCRIYVSTPKGYNEFYEQVRIAASRDKLIVLHWSVHPFKAQGLYKSTPGGTTVLFGELPSGYPAIQDGKLRSPWYDTQCARTSDKREIAQELDLDFHESSQPFFGNEEIQKLLEYIRPPIAKATLDSTGFDTQLLSDPFGKILLWYEEAAQAKQYVPKPKSHDAFAVGVDIAAGSGGEDSSNSVIIVMNCITKEVVAEFASNDIYIEELAETAIDIAKWFNNATLIWESNGIGASFGKYVLDTLKYPYLYLRRITNDLRQRVTTKPGWWSSPKEKRTLLTTMAIGIRNNTIRIYSRDIIRELSQYIYTEKGDIVHNSQRYGEAHGDRVIALALAYRAASDHLYIPDMPRNTLEPSIFSFAGRRKLANRKSRDESWL